jgi:hypothetical protein
MARTRRVVRAFVATVVAALAVSLPAQPVQPVQPAKALRAPIVLNDDGGWCWFQDERALVVAGRLVFGSVAAGRSDPSRRGMVEATSVDLRTGTATRFRLSTTLVQKAGAYDDHDTPAFAVRGDGRIVALWAGHAYDNRILSRVSLRPGDATAWGDERVFVPSPSSSITYSNLHRLAGERGRIYDFFRGLDNRFKPSVAWSDDEGETWKTGGVVIDVPAAFRHRPYVKYASNGKDTVHIVYTEGHPRDFDNSLYHAFYRGGTLHRSDGTVIRPLAEGLRDPVEGTRIFQGDPRNVAWVTWNSTRRAVPSSPTRCRKTRRGCLRARAAPTIAIAWRSGRDRAGTITRSPSPAPGSTRARTTTPASSPSCPAIPRASSSPRTPTLRPARPS